MTDEDATRSRSVASGVRLTPPHDLLHPRFLRGARRGGLTAERPRTVAEVPELGACWPRGEHRTLLEIACAPPSLARRAWADWIAALGDRDFDLGTARLLPLVARRLGSLGVSTHVAERLRGVYRHTWCTNQLRIGKVLSLVRALQHAGLPVMALKGLALLNAAYDGDFGSRAMLDIDLLVPPEDVARAALVLSACGWTPRHAPALAELSEGRLPLGENAYAFRKDDVELDLHWHFSRSDASAWLDRVAWQHRERTQLRDLVLDIPSPTELLLLVCVHGACWTKGGALLWPADALRLIERGAIAWERLVAVSRHRLLALLVYDTLRFVRDGLGAHVPASAMAELGACPVSEAERREYRALTTPRYCASFSDSVAARQLAWFRAESSGADGEPPLTAPRSPAGPLGETGRAPTST